MDKIIEKKKWPAKRIAMLVIPILGLLLLAYLMFAGSGSNSLSVDASRLSIAEVKYGNFADDIPITGNVEPLKSIFLTANEGGNVEEIFVEDGSVVNKGTPLMRLANSNLMLDFMNRETQIIEQINNLRNTRLSIEQNKRSLNDQLIDVDYQLKEAERQYRMDSALYNEDVIPDNDFQATRNNIDYLRKKRDFTKKNIVREEAIQETQLQRIDRSIILMERNLDAIRRNLENLTIKAPIDGQLTGFNHYLGETKQRGEALGQVDVMSGFLVRCFIDEFYLHKVRTGQLGSFTFAGQNHSLEVTKVLPQVSNGQFQVEMDFTDSIPPGIRRGQSLQIKLSLSGNTEALIVDRGGFYQSTGGKWAFVLTDENTAERRNIEMGRQSTDHVEILSGLEPGDRIITNSYINYGDAEILLLE